MGFVGLFIQLKRDNFFPYYDFNMIWNAVAMDPNTEVVVRVSNFCIIPWSPPYWDGRRFLNLQIPAKRRAAEMEPGNWKGWWLLYLFVLLPTATFLAYISVYVDAWYDVLFLANFLVFSTGGGVLFGHVKVRGHDQWFFPGLAAAYVAAVFTTMCIAALNAPTLPLVEVKTESDALPYCSELSKERALVKVSEAPNLLYLYNESGFFALSVFDVQPLPYHKDCPVLRTHG